MEALKILIMEMGSLSFNENEQDSLHDYFTNNVEKINVVTSFLPDYTTIDKKRVT
jgi:hypothetical protein